MQKQLNYDMFYNLVFVKQFVVYKLHSVLQPALLTIQSPFYFEYWSLFEPLKTKLPSSYFVIRSPIVWGEPELSFCSGPGTDILIV